MQNGKQGKRYSTEDFALPPEEIEKKSFAIIDEELRKRNIRLPEEEAEITKRAIHTGADFDYAQSMTYSENVVRIARRLLSEGADIVTDTQMARAGINKKRLASFGGQVFCFMSDEDVAKRAREEGRTRASVSMDKAAELLRRPAIFAIGNAPTALLRLRELYLAAKEGRGGYIPALVIAAPVGFVNVEAAKELILETELPSIVCRGRKGGSNIAAAIVNALLYGIPRETEPASPLRNGFTTGSCAAAAAKAAAYMLLSGGIKEEIQIQTPKGVPYTARLTDIRREGGSVACAVIKDGGDDPDVTTGAHIRATVRAESAEEAEESAGHTGEDARIRIDGGEGVGRVTLRGLDQPVGSAAINRVPREMIEKEVREVCRLFDFTGVLSVVISIPEGRALAEKTFNPRLGIEGGLSILGTTGIVEPMSESAILETIRLELRMRRARGDASVAVTPGNYGQEFMKSAYGYDLELSVKCGNFIGDTIDMAIEEGFSALLLTGHIGKLVKLTGGMFNTHSKYGDCRMELLASAALVCGAGEETLRKLLACVSTREAVAVLDKEEGTLRERTMKEVLFRMEKRLRERAAGRLRIECILYENAVGYLAGSEGAEGLLAEIEEACPKRL